MRGSDLCAAHHPETQSVRRAGARRGGKARGTAEVAAVKDQLQEIADRVLTGDLDRGAAAVVAQVLNVKLRAIETERRVREVDEVMTEIEELKRAYGVG